MDHGYIFTRNQDDVPDGPRQGFYQLLRRNRPPQPVAIWWGKPIDHETPEPMDIRTAPRLDRSFRWNMLINGQLARYFDDDDGDAPLWADVWPLCAGDPIEADEYLHLIASIDHAQKYDPDSAFANPRRRIDLDTVSMPL